MTEAEINTWVEWVLWYVEMVEEVRQYEEVAA